MVQALNPTLSDKMGECLTNPNISPAGLTQTKGKSRLASAKGEAAVPAWQEAVGPDRLPADMMRMHHCHIEELREQQKRQKIKCATARAMIAAMRMRLLKGGGDKSVK